MIYILVFLLSLFFIKCAQKFKHNKKLFYFFSILGIIIPCLLAAFRDYSIGTDTNEYVRRIFEQAVIDNKFFHFLKYSNSSVDDFLYLATSFFSARITSNISLLFFINQLLVILPIYIALVKGNKDDNRVVFGMFIYFMFFFNQSLNMARQSIALAFSVLGMQYLQEKKDLKFFILLIIASLFHSSAMVMIGVYLLYKFQLNKKISIKLKSYLNILILVIATALVFLLPDFLELLSNIRVFSDTIDNFLANYVRTSIDINWVNTLFYAFIAFIILNNSSKLKEEVCNHKFFSMTSILCFIVLQFGAVVKYSERIGFYIFYPLLFIILPKIFKLENKRIEKRDFINLILLISTFVVYWVFWIIILQYHETYPYIFRS